VLTLEPSSSGKTVARGEVELIAADDKLILPAAGKRAASTVFDVKSDGAIYVSRPDGIPALVKKAANVVHAEAVTLKRRTLWQIRSYRRKLTSRFPI
jgi:hypothetical protein